MKRQKRVLMRQKGDPAKLFGVVSRDLFIVRRTERLHKQMKRIVVPLPRF